MRRACWVAVTLLATVPIAGCGTQSECAQHPRECANVKQAERGLRHARELRLHELERERAEAEGG